MPEVAVLATVVLSMYADIDSMVELSCDAEPAEALSAPAELESD